MPQGQLIQQIPAMPPVGHEAVSYTHLDVYKRQLGYYRAPGVIALDSGCVWGNRLTAVRLDEPGVPAWSVPAVSLPPPP